MLVIAPIWFVVKSWSCPKESAARAFSESPLKALAEMPLIAVIPRIAAPLSADASALIWVAASAATSETVKAAASAVWKF